MINRREATRTTLSCDVCSTRTDVYTARVDSWVEYPEGWASYPDYEGLAKLRKRRCVAVSGASHGWLHPTIRRRLPQASVPLKEQRDRADTEAWSER